MEGETFQLSEKHKRRGTKEAETTHHITLKNRNGKRQTERNGDRNGSRWETYNKTEFRTHRHTHAESNNREQVICQM